MNKIITKPTAADLPQEDLRITKILEIQNLSCGYTRSDATIKKISFSVQKGDFLSIIGPNGAGKTTLFRAITGILKPKSGEILYKGVSHFKISHRDFAREVAVIPQNLQIPFAFTVEEFVSMGRFPHKNRFDVFENPDCQILENALQLTDTLSLRHRNINKISGGERQRVILAQGLAQEPQLLLLDEPTAHLDISHKVQILDLLKKLNQENGLTVIIILHDLNLASAYCDKLILLNKGEIFTQGTPNEVLTYENIKHIYNTEVLINKNPLDSRPFILLNTGNKNVDSEDKTSILLRN